MRRRFKRLLIHDAPTYRSDGAGGQTRVWVERGHLWADVDPGRGGLVVTAVGAEPRLRARITMHALPEGHSGRPSQGDRLRDGATVYEVEAVHETGGGGRYLTCHARLLSEMEGRA